MIRNSTDLCQVFVDSATFSFPNDAKDNCLFYVIEEMCNKKLDKIYIFVNDDDSFYTLFNYWKNYQQYVQIILGSIHDMLPLFLYHRINIMPDLNTYTILFSDDDTLYPICYPFFAKGFLWILGSTLTNEPPILGLTTLSYEQFNCAYKITVQMELGEVQLKRDAIMQGFRATENTENVTAKVDSNKTEASNVNESGVTETPKVLYVPMTHVYDDDHDLLVEKLSQSLDHIRTERFDPDLNVLDNLVLFDDDVVLPVQEFQSADLKHILVQLFKFYFKGEKYAIFSSFYKCLEVNRPFLESIGYSNIMLFVKKCVEDGFIIRWFLPKRFNVVEILLGIV